MSYLDSLENNLKALENQAERDPAEVRRKQEARANERAAAVAAEPFVKQLREGEFTRSLLGHCATLGYGLRLKVRPLWLGNVLRLEARDKQLDLEPSADGIHLVFREAGEVIGREPLDDRLDAAEPLAKRWLGIA
ncbi:MAG: hypothetical protein K2X03_30740 [Bryobacteraceae bacterium]|nr:hypothetical protein [Bryobacteraceae bacterium]